MRQVAAAPPTPPPPAPGQPIQPSNIVIPPDNPTAPKMNEVKPYTPPPGMSDYETVYVTGAPGQGGEGRAAGPRRSLAASATAGAQAKAAPSPSSRGSYQVATIQFTNGSSRLSESDRRILAQVEAQHRQVGGTLRVVGHTAGRAESDDQTVSQARADAVAAELERLGAKPDQVRTAAVGDSEPKYAESSPNGIAGNRRTEIFIDF
jgi:outer membrane protein OmpA-like peptidoglycan-associated protein